MNEHNYGYHMKKITRGEYGELSKVREELEEAEDALAQENPILLLCELSDLYGALEAYADTCGSDISELKKMSDATKRAFKNGNRK